MTSHFCKPNSVMNVQVSDTTGGDSSNAAKRQLSKRLRIIPTPMGAHITGQWNYCIPEAVSLAGYDGAGVAYTWLRNDTIISTDTSLLDVGRPVGDYGYNLVLSVTEDGVTCGDTSATDSVRMYGLPPAPTITGPTAINCSTYELVLAASEPRDGLYDWSDGTLGHTDTIYSGGAYQVMFTNLFGCTSTSSITVPYSPAYYFQYFPSGCYTLCKQQLPVTLYGPPAATFAYWAWLLNGTVDTSGAGFMSSLAIDSVGAYAWTLGNGLCTETSDPLNISTMDCKCQDSLTASLVCDTSSPAGYSITVNIQSPAPGTTYTMGTNIGPIDPFSGTLSSSGWQSMTLSFTTLDIYSMPSTVTVEVALTTPTGNQCFLTDTIALPSCSWVAERTRDTTTTPQQQNSNSQSLIANSLLVFPNPTTGNVTISYNYGSSQYSQRSLSVYNAVGSLVATTNVQDVQGTWNVNANNWAPGIYIIQMLGDGQTLQTQRLAVVSH